MGADDIQTINRLYEFFLLGLIALRGPGPIAADTVLQQQLARWFPPLESWSDAALTDVPHVVVVGAGFGGLKAAHGLRLAACRVTVIDKRNYHLFQPLLYQVATASLSPADVATPIRALFRDQHNVRVLLGEVAGVDAAARQVVLSDGARIGYDYLVLATGARHSYFGRDDWEPYAPGLKRIDDATAIRRRLLLAFEQAENCADPEERQRLLTFVIVGGGPTGVELAGAIAELARHGLAGEFRNIDPAQARVLLVQSAPRLLPAFPESLSEVSAQSLRALGVEVLTQSRVEKIDADGVWVSGQRIGSRTVFWAAGVMASPAAQWLQGDADAAGRLKVGPDLTVPGLPDVFAIGDTALSEAWNGKPVPGLAPAAKQQGAYVARLIKARLEGHAGLPPFRYHHLGNLATIGRQAAVVDFGGFRLSGALAWWLWGVAHVFFLVDTRKRLSVAIEWFWAYLTYKRGTRLITGGRSEEHRHDQAHFVERAGGARGLSHRLPARSDAGQLPRQQRRAEADARFHRCPVRRHLSAAGRAGGAGRGGRRDAGPPLGLATVALAGGGGQRPVATGAGGEPLGHAGAGVPDHSGGYGAAGMEFRVGRRAAEQLSAPVLSQRAPAAVVALHTLLGLGLMVGPLLADGFGRMGLWTGFPLSLLALSALLALTAATVRLPPDVGGETDRQTDANPPLSSGAFWTFAAIAVLYAFAEGTFGNWAAVYLREAKALPAGVAALALSVFWGAMVAGRLLVAVLVVRIAPLTIWLVLPVLMIAAFLLLPGADTPALGLGLFALAGLACSAFSR